ncbi:MAG: DNA polymerase III subunit delta' [Rhodospirillales bacterium]
MNDDAAEFARYGRPPPPRANCYLSGHEEAERLLLALARADRLPHGWLISGPAGIGKATLAYRFARWLLSWGSLVDGLLPAGAGAGGWDGLHVDPAHPVFRRIASGGHADLLTIERAFDEARGRLKSEIPVDDIRRIPAFFAGTPAEGAWRVVVVDGADQMNRNAANALLKCLEEPPPRSLLLLVADRPGVLPATVRSRCRRLPLRPLPRATVEALLGRYTPDLATEAAGRIAALNDGSIGRALAFAASDGVALHGELHRLLLALPQSDPAALHAFCDKAAAADAAFTETLDLLREFISRVVHVAAGASPDGDGGDGIASAAPPGVAVQLRRIAGAAPLDRWLAVWDNVGDLLAHADSARLDRKQLVLSAAFIIGSAMRPEASPDLLRSGA